MHLSLNLLCLISVNSKTLLHLCAVMKLCRHSVSSLRKQKRMSNLSSVYYSKILWESCFYYRRLYILFVTATRCSALFFFSTPALLNSPPPNGTQTYITAPEQHQCGPWTSRHNQIQCVAVRLKGSTWRKTWTRAACCVTVVGTSLWEKSVHIYKKNNVFVQRYIFMKIHL